MTSLTGAMPLDEWLRKHLWMIVGIEKRETMYSSADELDNKITKLCDLNLGDNSNEKKYRELMEYFYCNPEHSYYDASSSWNITPWASLMWKLLDNVRQQRRAQLAAKARKDLEAMVQASKANNQAVPHNDNLALTLKEMIVREEQADPYLAMFNEWLDPNAQEAELMDYEDSCTPTPSRPGSPYHPSVSPTHIGSTGGSSLSFNTAPDFSNTNLGNNFSNLNLH
ncbi:hypothetical protein HD553DRAFT_346653 [Filobasidium floriforme]|uniref:uncharacterized protein n=1 Tax=Filobasidium floriforme TaxID=5210 RepID=UPI001E8DFEA7|nr:uncharacterized protein HD553DRAFT_346653 [Filobasidium floriforme]KAH8077478.1 hypothetical protein HD553DRAFT_346653 [Filobasidium floriforme]